MSKTTDSVYVKVPFCHGQHKFKIFKGRRWGVVDHVLLQEVAQRPSSAQKLSEISGLPRRLIIEIMIPFMRVGWVQLTPQSDSYVFEATQNGLVIAAGEELPIDREPITSIRQFLIDPVTGKCYRVGNRQQNFQVYKRQRAAEIAAEKAGRIADLIFDKIESAPFESDIYASVAEQDEDIVGYEDYAYDRPYSQTIRYAIATIDRHLNISGIPADSSDELKERIISAAEALITKLNNTTDLEKAESFRYQAASAPKLSPAFEILEEDYSLILGAEKHKQFLLDAIERSTSRLIIHSTFINPENFEKLFDQFATAARRGVQIDILWGQIEPDIHAAANRYQETIKNLHDINERMRRLGLGELFHIHTEPTGSHAKIIAFESDGIYSASFGSCNWLASGFNRFEASVLINDTSVFIETISILSQLARGLSKTSTSLSRELAVLTKHLKPKHSTVEASAKKIPLQIILSNEHHKLVRRARDEAKNNIFICSHRISDVADRPIITPLKTSTSNNEQVYANLYYGALSGGLTRENAERLSEDLISHSISLEKVIHPTIHAKILSWDNDNAVISSLNWLSASASGDDYDEIGIYIQDSKIANKIHLAFFNEVNISRPA